MVDVTRGVLRVRKWPKKRGTPKSALQRWWNSWFTQANELAKYADAASMTRAIDITAGSGMYPRDYLLKAMRGRLYVWRDQTGWIWHSMAGRLDISGSLDVLGQTLGDLLVRGTTYWAPATDGAVGKVMTHQGPDFPPKWIAPAGGGGVTQEVLVGTPIVPDGTKTLYDLDVSAYVSVDLIMEGLGFNLSDRPVVRFSTDGGSTFKAGASDYRSFFASHGQSGSRLFGEVQTTYRDAASSQNGVLNFTNLRAGRASWTNASGTTTALAFAGGGFATFVGPITDIRILAPGGKFFNAGTIRFVGLK